MFVHRLTPEKLRGKARFANNAPEQDVISSRRALSEIFRFSYAEGVVKTRRIELDFVVVSYKRVTSIFFTFYSDLLYILRIVYDKVESAI